MQRWLLSILLLPCLASAEIYRWTDANGQVHFGEAPRAGAVQIEVKPPALQQDAAAAERQQRTERFFQARREEQQKTNENNQKQQAKSAQECQQLREQYAQLDHGGTFYKVDAQGQRQYFQQEQIDSARNRLKARLAQRCN